MTPNHSLEPTPVGASCQSVTPVARRVVGSEWFSFPGISAHMTYRVTLLTLLLIMGLFSLFGCAKKPDLDESVLIQLKKADADLSKPHHIEFFLYFQTRDVAEQAASEIREAGFVVEVKPAAQGTDWLCYTTKTMVPELAALQRIRLDFNLLAASLGGVYDGWGTPVEK